MSSPPNLERIDLPESFVAVPVEQDQIHAQLWIGIVIRGDAPDPASHLIVVREALDAKVLLAGLFDQEQTVHRWLELWVQDPEGAQRVPLPASAEFTNQQLDDLWMSRVHAFQYADPAGCLRTKWEKHHPAPIWIDVKRFHPVHPAPKKGAPSWTLCTDDQILQDHDLPPYHSTAHRYLTAEIDKKRRFQAVTPDAPENEHVDPRSAVHPSTKFLVPVNPTGGLMLVRQFDPVSLDTYMDSLNDQGSLRLAGSSELVRVFGDADTDPGTTPGTTADAYRDHADGSNDGWLLLGGFGRRLRLLETFRLKLQALIEAARAVQRAVGATHAPLLSLRSEQFCLRLGPQSNGTPWRWTCRVVLKDAARALGLSIPGTDEKHFLPLHDLGASVYDLPGVGSPRNNCVRGIGSVRLRQVLDNKGGSVTLDGTLAAHEHMEPGRSHVLWMRLPVNGRRLDLAASIDEDAALAAGEWRFRSRPLHVDDVQAIDAMRQSEGLRFDSVAFTLIPLLSSACDLYSLAVLATRMLLVDDQTTLPKAIDEVWSLARTVAAEHDPNVGIGLRIQGVFDQDDRWVQSLGPHRLSNQFTSPEEAFAVVPPVLWWRALGVIVQSLPGVGPDSICRDASDAPPEFPERVFAPIVDELRWLIRQSDSLLMPDLAANQEIHSVVERLASRLTEEA